MRSTARHRLHRPARVSPCGVSGHNPKLVIGDLEGTRVAVFGGRAHYYESGKGDAMRLPLEVLKALGPRR
jgi:purine-nucleoside phosphorylase